MISNEVNILFPCYINNCTETLDTLSYILVLATELNSIVEIKIISYRCAEGHTRNAPYNLFQMTFGDFEACDMFFKCTWNSDFAFYDVKKKMERFEYTNVFNNVLTIQKWLHCIEGKNEMELAWNQK